MLDLEFSHLTHLYIRSCQLNDHFVIGLSKFKTLSCLDLGQNPLITWEGLFAVLTQLPSLLTLSLKQCLGIDFGLTHQKIIEANPDAAFQIACLNLNGCTQLSLEAFKNFIQFFKNLDTLNLSHCGELLTTDWRLYVPSVLI